MRYVTFRRYVDDNTLCGHRLNLSYGTPVHTIDDSGSDMLLTEQNEAVCMARSQDGCTHFARDDDGRGLERGAYTYAIAHASRQGNDGFRFTADEIGILVRDWSHWLLPGNAICFNDDFYRGDVSDLRALARSLGITVKMR